MKLHSDDILSHIDSILNMALEIQNNVEGNKENQGKIKGIIKQVLNTVGFWCQRIAQKNFRIFDTSFDQKLMVTSGAIEIIFKSHEPFQSGQAQIAFSTGSAWPVSR